MRLRILVLAVLVLALGASTALACQTRWLPLPAAELQAESYAAKTCEENSGCAEWETHCQRFGRTRIFCEAGILLRRESAGVEYTILCTNKLHVHLAVHSTVRYTAGQLSCG